MLAWANLVSSWLWAMHGDLQEGPFLVPVNTFDGK